MSHSRDGEGSKKQTALRLVFLAYLVFLCYIMFFAEMLGRTETDRQYSYNLEPFREISRFLRYRERLGMRAVLWNLGGNVLCFMPFGFLLPCIRKNMGRWYLSVLFSFYLSLMIETTQLILKVGSFDVDDLLLNTLGGLLGFLCYRAWQKAGERNKKE